MPIDVAVGPDVFQMPLKVRYYEADQQAVVYHGWYLNYFDEAFIAYMDDPNRGRGAMSTTDADVMLVHTEIDWHASLRWPGEATIAVSLVGMGNSSVTMDFAAISDGVPVCSARTVYVVVDNKDFQRIAIPEVMREALGHPAPLRRQRAGR